MPSDPQGGAQTASQGRHGGLCLGVWLETRFTLLAEIILAEKSLATFHFSETFREHQFWARALLFDYCRVVFPEPLLFQGSPGFRKGLFFVVIRLVNLFPPQILGWGPSAKWGAGATLFKPFHLKPPNFA